ncbi:serine hydrolase [Streptomyces sp. NPDC005955]|uniref:serine hydrolase domain-containing protein n=1 Tax=Streptomyces sp. NPDC005955 TaxID=3364738 RepID=UPI0036CB4C88
MSPTKDRVTWGAAKEYTGTFSCWWNRSRQSVVMSRHREAEAEIDRRVLDYMRRRHVPGISLGIARGERLFLAKGYGWADQALSHGPAGPLRLPVSAQPEHLYRIASISKPLTAVAVMTLIANDRLHLDDRVFGADGVLDARFPIPAAAPDAGKLRKITVRHLLEHTSGWDLGGDDDVMFLNDPAGPRLSMSQDELIDWVLTHRAPTAEPGTTAHYSNFGYCVLGRVIEAISGHPYATYVRAAVLDPCGIADMRIAANERLGRAPGEVRYYPNGTGTFDPCHRIVANKPYELNVSRMDAHGGWVASVVDLLRFAVRTDGLSTVADLLTPTGLHTMTTPSAADASRGLAWEIRTTYELVPGPYPPRLRRLRTWGHRGLMVGTLAHLLIRDDGLALAALGNSRPAEDCSAAEFVEMLEDIAETVSGWSSWPVYDLFACY